MLDIGRFNEVKELFLEGTLNEFTFIHSTIKIQVYSNQGDNNDMYWLMLDYNNENLHLGGFKRKSRVIREIEDTFEFVKAVLKDPDGYRTQILSHPWVKPELMEETINQILGVLHDHNYDITLDNALRD